MLIYDIVLDEDAFKKTAEEMQSLVKRTSELKKNLKDLYDQLKKSLDTPAGREVEFTASKVLLQPISDLEAVLRHISGTLEQIKGTGYYKDVFVKFEELNNKIK